MEMYDENWMTTEERRIANAALGAGPWANHDQVVIIVADGLGLEPTDVEAALMRLRFSEVLNCVHYVKDSVCYEEGKNWKDVGRIRRPWYPPL